MNLIEVIKDYSRCLIDKLKDVKNFSRFNWALGFLTRDTQIFVTNLLILGIEKTNNYKDRGLSYKLHKLADNYDPVPKKL